MDAKVKAQWVAALRSGEYEQATDQLRRIEDGKSSFCCLGVLCDLAAKAGIGTWVNGEQFQANGVVEGMVPPSAVHRWAGLDDPIAIEVHPGVKVPIDAANDGVAVTRRYSFAQLADLIEDQL